MNAFYVRVTTNKVAATKELFEKNGSIVVADLDKNGDLRGVEIIAQADMQLEKTVSNFRFGDIVEYAGDSYVFEENHKELEGYCVLRDPELRDMDEFFVARFENVKLIKKAETSPL